jgi:hypothetical protein
VATNRTINDRVVALVPLAAYAGHEQDPVAWTAGGALYIAFQAAGASFEFTGTFSGDHVLVWEARDTTTDPRTDSDWSPGTPVSVSAPAPAAPVIAGVPTIAGTAQVGETLVATAATVTGTPAPARSWQWERAGAPIAGATGGAYTLTAADAGATVSVVQTETNTQGADSAESAATGIVATSPGTAPSAGSAATGLQDGQGGFAVVLADITEDAPDSHLILTAAPQTALTSLQVRAGTDETGAPAAASAAFSVTQASPDPTVSGLSVPSGSYHVYLVLGDAGGDYSDPIHAGSVTLDLRAPVIGQVTASATGAGTADWDVRTDEAGGTIHVRARPSGDPAWTAAEIIAAADDTFSPAEAAPALFLVAGQSNAVGRADFDGGTPHPADAFQWTQAGAEAPASSPLDHVDEQAGDMGFDVQFALDFAAANPGRKIVFIPSADGGTGFSDNQWNPGNPRFADAAARANAAIAHYGTGLAGILWHQGERDAQGWSQAQYRSALQDMILGMRAAITNGGGVPFVVGEIGAFLSLSPYSTRDAVNAAINETAEDLLHTAVVETGDLADGGDSIHFGAPALRTMGARYHAAWVAARGNVSAPVITGAPTIVGTVAVGQTVGAVAAPVAPRPAATSWQWELDGAPVGGATSASYTIQAGDLGGVLTVVQTATGAGGSATAESAGQAVAAAPTGSAIETAVDASVSDAFWAPTDDPAILWRDIGQAAPVTSSGDPVAYIAVPNGTLDLVQPNAGDLPLFDAATGLLDCSTDTSAHVQATAANLGSDMYFAFVIDSTAASVFSIAVAGGDYAGYANNASTSTAVDAGVGAPSYRVDGVTLTGPTRATLQAAICDGAPHVVEIAGLDLTGWTDFALGNRGTGSPHPGRYGDFVLCDTPSTADQDAIRAELAARHGIPL